MIVSLAKQHGFHLLGVGYMVYSQIFVYIWGSILRSLATRSSYTVLTVKQ